MHVESVFRVTGMCCAEEVAILERRLTPLAGVDTLSADVLGQKLHIAYDAALLDTARIVDAVAETGMRAWLEHETPVEHRAPTTTRGGSGRPASPSAAGLLVAGPGRAGRSRFRCSPWRSPWPACSRRARRGPR